MLFIFVILGIVVNVIISNIIGNLGKEKKIGYSTSFWVSFLLSPIIGILMVIASVPLSDQDKDKLKLKPENDEPIELTPEEKYRFTDYRR